MYSLKYRQLFSEQPYGASLTTENLKKRCSTCFAVDSAISCSGGCDAVVYCSDQCRSLDQLNHNYECDAFKATGSRDIDAFVRLLGRILARRVVDQGSVHLCSNFPKHIADRSLNDLMSHQQEIEKSRKRCKEMKKTLKEFSLTFHGTPLLQDWNLVRTMYCVMWTNCFCVSGPLSLDKGHDDMLGYGFYLNTSRFNHSCSPTLHVHFDGARLVLQYPSSLDADDETVQRERVSLTESATKLNSLTISYGYAASFCNSSYFPLRQQRRASLLYSYFFHCQCPLCDDEREATLEEHAALLECDTCGEPYFWVRKPHGQRKVACWVPVATKMEPFCSKSCTCVATRGESKKCNEYVRGVQADLYLPSLEKKWKKVMRSSLRGLFADDVVALCAPIHGTAQRLWHPTANLRLCQLNERLFVSHTVLILWVWEQRGPIDRNDLQLALDTGEDTIGWFNRHLSHSSNSAIAAYAYELAQVYEIAAATNSSNTEATREWNRACYWYSFAASIWRAFDALDFVVKLQGDAQKCKEAAAELRKQLDEKEAVL